MKKERLNIITINDFKSIKDISFFREDVLVVNTDEIYKIHKPNYPVRMKYFVFIYCFDGTSSLSINTVTYSFSKGQIMVIPSESVMEIHELKDFKATFLIISHQYMKEAILPLCAKFWNPLNLNTQNLIHDLDDGDGEMIMSYIWKLSDCCQKDYPKYKEQIVRFQILSLLHELCNINSFRNRPEDPPHDRNMQIYTEFLKLVSDNFKEEHTVAFYANKMCITAKYLSTAAKSAAGKSPSEIIQRYLIQEAMVLLKTTNKTIKEISIELNFQNSSFFCRYFHKYTGLTPNEYRQKTS